MTIVPGKRKTNAVSPIVAPVTVLREFLGHIRRVNSDMINSRS
jgi:hypothetical protein